MKKNNSRELLFFEEEIISLKAIIAIDSIVLGPANSSIKLHNYSSEDEAITDALDIAYYNSLKSALLRRGLGGGSIVLCGDPKKVKSEMYFRALGIFLNRWNGKILMTKGTGVGYNDLRDINKESEFLLGIKDCQDGWGKPSKSRARGMIWGMRAAAKNKLDCKTLKGLKVSVQGVGELGAELVKLLIEEGADITITDIVYDKIKVIQDKVNDIKIVRPTEIYKEKCDIFCACSKNYLLDENAASELNCRILTGSVDKVLKNEKLYDILNQKNILYIPGYVINSGDIIQFALENKGRPLSKLKNELQDIYYSTLDLIEKHEKQKIGIEEIAVKQAEKYIKDIATVKMLK